MKNEDKAEEICINIQPPYIDFIYQNYKTAMEMAEWKDKQYAELIAPILIELDELKQQVKSLLP